MFKLSKAALAASTAIAAVLLNTSLNAQTAQQNPAQTPAVNPLEVTVTADRVPTSIQRTGSAITVLPGAEIAKASQGSLTDALRQVPGLDIAETGGPGSTATIRLRGANSGQTLVLVDGVRVNDSSGPSGEFDTSIIAPGLIDRIEVLRGPQSALYGSDAIGGVVNIITKKGRGAPSFSLRTEAGSYRTISTIATAAGTIGDWNYALSGSAMRSEGFSRYGYRIGRLESRLGKFEKDAMTRFGGFGRIGYDPGNGFRFDVGVTRTETRSEYDAAFGTFPDTPSLGKKTFTQVSAKAELDTFDRMLTHSIQLFANRTARVFYDSSFATLQPGNRRGAETRTFSEFIGERLGAEYQGTLRMKQFGSLIFGGRVEKETVDTFDQNLAPVMGLYRRGLTTDQTTRSAFALWQLPIGERLTFSFGGRHDGIENGDTFNTWRATAAYRILETDTKLRASAGTGGKAPTLFQRFSPQFGTANLESERSRGFDVGIDQRLFNGRVTASLTGFTNRYSDMIDFQVGRGCRPTQAFGCYVNVARAKTSGIEATAKAEVIEGLLSVSGNYTYLHAKDLATNLTLARRPQHNGRVALQITPLPGWLIEPSLVMVSGKFSSAAERDRLAPYARLDVYTEYQVNQTVKVHARVENATNARYQEVLNYGTTGRAAYAGLTATW
ncbi:MAG: TonB-dependent receptor plug domain-containing protein [Bosea sp. (in: a-proteobacteria)]